MKVTSEFDITGHLSELGGVGKKWNCNISAVSWICGLRNASYIISSPLNNTKDKCYYSHLSDENIEASKDSTSFPRSLYKKQGPDVTQVLRLSAFFSALGGLPRELKIQLLQVSFLASDQQPVGFRAIAGQVFSLRIASGSQMPPPQVSRGLASPGERWRELSLPSQKLWPEITTPHLCLLILHWNDVTFRHPKFVVDLVTCITSLLVHKKLIQNSAV